MTEKLPRAIFGDPEKPLIIGDIQIPCYILEDKKRILSGRGMQDALALGQSHGAKMKQFMGHTVLKPFINNELAMALANPIRFIRPGRGGKLAMGYEATILVDICDAVLNAREAKALKTSKQITVAKQCEILTRAFARVGIIALVDEATGFQEVRDREILQIILNKYIKDEWAKWTKRFPDDFYKELFRLRNIPYPGHSMKRPRYIGHWTNDIIYSRLAPGVKKALRKKNPRQPSGYRERKHHQYLTEDLGIPKLQEHLSNIIFLMKGCTSWDDFRRRINRASPKYGDTITLDFEIDGLQDE